MKSMTGFGRGETTAADLTLAVELNAVNRRNLETSFSLPREWQSLERDIAEVVRGGVGRGKVHATVRADRASGAGAFSWDRTGVEAFLDKAGALAEARGIVWPPDGAGLAAIIALHRTDSDLPAAEDIRTAVAEATGAALAQLNEMRAREGAHLAADLACRLGRLRSLLADIRANMAGSVARYRELLLQRLKAAGLDLDLDDERVLKEIALFADRCDTTEEVTRLDSHLAQFAETLKAAADNAVGRKLEFILQEINREFNTIGAKANNVDVSRFVIEAKNEIERIREQVQNVE